MSLGQLVSCQSCSYESSTTRVEYCLNMNVTLGMTPEELKTCRDDSQVAQRSFLYRRGMGMGSKTSESSASPTTLGELIHEFMRLERIAEWQCEKCKNLGGVRTVYLQR